MSLQSEFDLDPISIIPRVHLAVLYALPDESFKMRKKAETWIRVCGPIDEMDEVEFNDFEDNLLATFKLEGWMK